MSGLICLDWYDWNPWSIPFWWIGDYYVGIDLFGLIRLKPLFIKRVIPFHKSRRDWSVWIDTIETVHNFYGQFSDLRVGIDLFGLIRLKHKRKRVEISQLITVGIDLFGLIRLKLQINLYPAAVPAVVGIDLFGFIRLKHHIEFCQPVDTGDWSG